VRAFDPSENMAIVLGIDLGTTTLAGLALDCESGAVVARHSLPNDAEVTSPADRALGRSEWDAQAISARAAECLRNLAEQLEEKTGACAALGITGQQHGVVLVDEALQPLTPFINWQDQRAASGGSHPGFAEGRTFLDEAIARLGPDAPRRAGCRLATGYLGATLFWLKVHDLLPARGRACFLGDFFAARLTGRGPVSEPTYAASSGLLDLGTRDWDLPSIEALGLPLSLFPPVCEAGTVLGVLQPEAARLTGLPEGLPVCVAIGDNQAAFLGCVADRDHSVLVNVGTGAQVAAFAEQAVYRPPLEVRPFPRAGNLLVNAGLSGGRVYALLERFFRGVGEQLLDTPAPAPLYERMNALAAGVPRGAGGLRCEPFFAGTRSDPARRATITGASLDNFTPAHLVRALLEGMARALAEGHRLIAELSGRSFTRLVGGGNGLRENAVLAGIVAEEFALPMTFGRHREEAAVGAALAAAVGVGLFDDLSGAGRLVEPG
jgi:sugar (pentulose or hexulose) kinase